MRNTRPFNVLDDLAKDFIPDNTNLIPQVASQLGDTPQLHAAPRLQRKTLMTQMRARPLLAVLIALLILLVVSGAVYALGRAFGYVPGIGLVSQDAPLRILAEPVSMTRDGVTLTVKEAVLSAENTTLLLSVENLPVDKLSPDGAAGSGCGLLADVLLPDGTPLKMDRVWGQGWEAKAAGTSYFARFTFAPMPAQISSATLSVPCLASALPGVLPENWTLPLRFAPAPPDMTVVPVTQVAPAQPAATTETGADQNPLALEKVIETDTGYLLTGTFHPVGLQDTQVVGFSQYPLLTDASGQTVPFNLADYQLNLPAQSPAGGFPWGVDIIGKQFAWPLTLTIPSIVVAYPDAQTSFTFDAGANPQPEQTWDLNLELTLAGQPLKVTKAARTPDGYSFNFESQTLFHGVNLAIGDASHSSTGMDDPNHFSAAVKFSDTVPAGKLTVQVSRPMIALAGSWQLTWQPANAAALTPAASLAPTQPPQACLTADTWKAAQANPAPLPDPQNGRVSVFGRVLEDGKPLSGDNFNLGLYFSRLDGSEKQVIGADIFWASPSPDGAEVAYDHGKGVEIKNLVTGETRPVPNTTPDDIAPFWSPDGTVLAFTRVNEEAFYRIHPDGTGLQKLTSGMESKQMIGWLPDSSTLLYGTPAQDNRMALKQLDVRSGTVSNLFELNMYVDVSISPDGKQLAFLDRLDAKSYGLYTSNLDGSTRRLLAIFNDTWRVMNPRWSPDGQWLIVNIYDTLITTQDDPATALVNPQTCQIIPLPITRNIRSWVP